MNLREHVPMLLLRCLATWLLGSGLALAQDGEPEQARQALEAVDRKLGELQEHRESLAGRLERAEHMAIRTRELYEIRNGSRERLAEYEKQMADLRESESEGQSLRERLFQQEFAKYLTARRDLDVQIMALEEVADLGKAQDLVIEVEKRELEWWLVAEAQHGFEVELEHMQQFAIEAGTMRHREAIGALLKLHQRDLANRVKELELAKSRLSNQSAMRTLLQQFWAQE